MSVFAEFLVPVTAFPLGRFLTARRDVTVEVERVVPTGGFTHYVWLAGDDAETVVEAVRDADPVATAEVVDELPDRTLVRVDWAGRDAPLFDLVRENAATLVDAGGSHDGWTVTLRLPGQEALSSFYEECARRGIDVDLQRSYEVGSPGDDGGFGLSPVQQETLDAAFRAGYFEVPRRATIQDLAEKLDVSEQAVSERLRRALSTLLMATMAGEGPRDDG